MRRVFYFFVSVILCLVSAELALRAYNHFSPSFIFYSDSYERFRGQPGQQLWGYPLNSLGFMDVEFPEKSAHKEKYRILALGDSFTFGIVPYPKNFITLLEEKLQQQNANVEILNMGITQTGPREQLALLLNEGLEYKPDMVLLSFFIGNDFLEAGRKETYERSYLASLLYYLFNIRPQLENKQFGRKGQYCDECPTLSREKYLFVQRRRSVVFQPEKPMFKQLSQQALAQLANIKKVCDKHGIAFKLVIIPDELQVNKSLLADLDANFMNGEKVNWNLGQPNQVLKEFFQEQNISFLDLTTVFAANNSNQPLYKPYDSHWNIAGNQLAAEQLMPFVMSSLPESASGVQGVQ